MTEKESVNSNIINHFSLHHVAVEIQAHVATSPTDHVRRGDVHVRKRILAGGSARGCNMFTDPYGPHVLGFASGELEEGPDTESKQGCWSSSQTSRHAVAIGLAWLFAATLASIASAPPLQAHRPWGVSS